MAGKPVVGDRRVAGWRGRRERAERIVAGFRAGHICPAGSAQGRYVAQVVGVGVVERPRGRAHLRLHGHDLPRQPVGRVGGVGFVGGSVRGSSSATS